MIYHSLINVIAWTLMVAGGIAFVAAGIGVVFFLVTSDHSSEVASSLHDTYYVIRHSKRTSGRCFFA